MEKRGINPLKRGLLATVGTLWITGNSALWAQSQVAVNNPTEQKRWAFRIATWQTWSRLSEKEMLLAYQQASDSWLREHVPAIPPLRVEEGKTRLTSSYGYRKHPVSKQWTFHKGIDLSGSQGQPVYAAAQGMVQKVGVDRYLGNYIVISHAGLFSTTYGHLARILVTKGQLINREDCIGRVGKTGRCTGYHLHYMVKRLGKPVDADPYLFLRFGITCYRQDTSAFDLD